MKVLKQYLPLTALFISMLSTCFSQNLDSSVEVKLQLLRQVVKPNGDTVHGLAVSVSIINHSNKNVYIPGFSSIQVHYYDNSDSVWREINLGCKDYHNSISFSDGGRSPCEIWPSDNDISTYYKGDVHIIHKLQRDILASCLGKNIYVRTIPPTHIYGDHLFLNAKQIIDNYWVIPIENLFFKRTQYQITFNTEKIDRYMLEKHMEHFPPQPNQLERYQIYMPDKIVSNVIYFSTKDSKLH